MPKISSNENFSVSDGGDGGEVPVAANICDRILLLGLSDCQKEFLRRVACHSQKKVDSVEHVREALFAIEHSRFSCIYISIEGVDEFAPAVISQIRKLPNAGDGTDIIAIGNYIPSAFSSLLTASGFTEVQLTPCASY